MKAFLLANISDVLSTVFGLNVGGIEANPMIQFVIDATSVPEALLVKLAVAAGVALMINRWKPRLLAIPTVAFTLIAISNSLIVISYA